MMWPALLPRVVTIAARPSSSMPKVVCF